MNIKDKNKNKNNIKKLTNAKKNIKKTKKRILGINLLYFVRCLLCFWFGAQVKTRKKNLKKVNIY